MADSPIWIPNQKYSFLKIANPAADASYYYDKKYNPDIAYGIGRESIKCAYSSCETLPQTVCFVCNEYVYKDGSHKHTHYIQNKHYHRLFVLYVMSMFVRTIFIDILIAIEVDEYDM